MVHNSHKFDSSRQQTIRKNEDEQDQADDQNKDERNRYEKSAQYIWFVMLIDDELKLSLLFFFIYSHIH